LQKFIASRYDCAEQALSIVLGKQPWFQAKKTVPTLMHLLVYMLNATNHS